eukprot:1157875-Pelagomonas_calceolata.AAC.2
MLAIFTMTSAAATHEDRTAHQHYLICLTLSMLAMTYMTSSAAATREHHTALQHHLLLLIR